MFFPLIKIEHTKLDLKLIDLAQPSGLGLLAQSPSLKTQFRNRYKTLKIKQGFFCLNLIKSSEEQRKEPKNMDFNLDHIMLN